LTTKIIFSDGKVQFFKAADAALCHQLKEAQSDKGVNDFLKQFEESFAPCEEADAGDIFCTVDLHKKKRSSVKRMKKAFGGR
jgi:hypothetical protein